MKKIYSLLISGLLIFSSCGVEKENSTDSISSIESVQSVYSNSTFSSQLSQTSSGMFSENGRYGFYSPTGEKIDITDIADRITWGGFSNGLIEFEKDKKKGLLSENGEIIVPAEYVYIEVQYSGLIWANRTNDAFWATNVYWDEWIEYVEPFSSCEFSFLDYSIFNSNGELLYETPYIFKVNHGNLLGIGNEITISSEVVFNEDRTSFRIYDLNESMLIEQDVNGLWGIQNNVEQNGELVNAPPNFFPPDPFYWGQYQDKPKVEVIEWTKDLSYQFYQ